MKRSYDIPFLMGMAYIALALTALTGSLSQRLINALSLGAVLLSISELLNVCNMQKVKKRSVIDVLNHEGCKDKYGVATLYIEEILKEKNSVLKRNTSFLSILSILFNAFAFMCLLVYPHSEIMSAFEQSDRFSVFCTIISIGIVFISIAINNRKELDDEIRDTIELVDCFNLVTDEANKQVEKAVKLAENVVSIKNENPHTSKKSGKNKGNRK